MNIKTNWITRIKTLAIVVAIGCMSAILHAAPGKGRLKVFILAGQSNMDGQANVSTIDFLGEDPDPARAALLKKFKPDGKTLVTRSDVWVASDAGYFRFFRRCGFDFGSAFLPAMSLSIDFKPYPCGMARSCSQFSNERFETPSISAAVRCV